MVSRLLEKVNAMPESRPEVVSEYQSKMSRGNYPPPMLIEGFARLMGKTLNAGISHGSDSGTSSSDSQSS